MKIDRFQALFLVIISLVFTMTASFAQPVFAGPLNIGTKTVVKGLEEILELASRISGRSLGPVARCEALKQLERVELRYGTQALKAAGKGGLELMEAAGKYGDDIWKFSRAYPAGARSLALHPETYLPLCRKYGSEVLALEAKAVGTAPSATKFFGKEGVNYLAVNAPAKDIPVILGMAAKAENRQVSKKLFELYRRTGGAILKHLEPKRILAYGLSGSMLMSAYQVSSGMKKGIETVSESVGNATETVAQNAPDTVGENIREVTAPFTYPVSVIIFIALSMLLYRFRRFFLGSTHKKEKHRDDKKEDEKENDEEEEEEEEERNKKTKNN